MANKNQPLKIVKLGGFIFAKTNKFNEEGKMILKPRKKRTRIIFTEYVPEKQKNS